MQIKMPNFDEDIDISDISPDSEDKVLPAARGTDSTVATKPHRTRFAQRQSLIRDPPSGGPRHTGGCPPENGSWKLQIAAA